MTQSRFPAPLPHIGDPKLRHFLEALRQEVERIGTSGGGGGTTIAVETSDTLVGSGSFGTLDFSARFSVSENPTGEANIELNTVSVGYGGTGRVSLTSNALLVGAGAAAVGFLPPGAAGQVVRSTGTAWASAQLAFADLTGIAARAQLPAAVAYEDEANSFSPTQNFTSIRWTGRSILGDIVAGEAISAGDVVFLHNDGAGNLRWLKASASAANFTGTLIPTVGIAVAGAGAGANVDVCLAGRVTVNKGAEIWASADVGKAVYVDTVAGEATLVAPGAVGSVVFKLGNVLTTAGEISVQPMYLGEN